MNNCSNNNLYIISFVVGADSGLALLSARSEREAIQILRNSGKYNGFPHKYQILQARNIGLSNSIRSELLMESYINALAAYDAIVSATSKFEGRKGDPGSPGGFGNIDAEVDKNFGEPYVDVTTEGPNDAKDIHFTFHNIRGERGASIVSVEQTSSSDEDEGLNEITITLEDGTESKVYVRNGRTGVTSATASVDDSFGNPVVGLMFEDGELSFSFSGIRGMQGNPGVNNATMLVVDYLPQASAETSQKIYLILNEDTGDYDRYFTQYDGITYSWVQCGSMTVNMEDYIRKDSEVWLTREEFDALPIKDITKTYNIYEEDSDIEVGPASSGSGSADNSSESA